MLLLCLSEQSYLAAQRGHPGGHGQPPTPGTGIPAEDSDMANVKRAFELQATADQIELFKAMARTTGKAIEQAGQIPNLAANPGGLAGQSGLFGAIMDDLAQRDKEFLASFNGVQKSNLKKLARSLHGADSEVARLSKDLNKQLRHNNPGGAQIARSSSDLRNALFSLRSAQNSLATEMGIDLSATVRASPTSPVLTPR